MSLKTKSYAIVVGKRTLNSLRTEHSYQVIGKMMWYDAPAGFIPGADDDDSKGFQPGSEIVAKDGNVYKCIDATARKAVWAQVSFGLTKNSWKEGNEPAAESKPAKPAPPAKKESKPMTIGLPDRDERDKDLTDEPPTAENVKKEKEAAAESKPAGDDKQNGETAPIAVEKAGRPDQRPAPSGLPEDVPWRKFLVNHNSIGSVSDLQAARNKGLGDLKYINSDRAKAIEEWMDTQL